MPDFASAGNRTMPPCHCSVLGFRSGGMAKEACAPGCRRMTSALAGSAASASPAAIVVLSDAANAARSRASDHANFSQPSSAAFAGPSEAISAMAARPERNIENPLLRQSGRGKTVLCERALAFRRENEHCEFVRRRRGAVHHGQAVVGADRERVGQCDDLLRRVLALRGQRIGAIGQENIGRTLRDELAIDRAALRRGRARGPAGELQRFLLERGGGACLELLGFTKNLPGVIAGRIGLRRRGAELDSRNRACGPAARPA